jgi:hypothetical protein
LAYSDVMTDDTTQKLDIDWLKTIGGALAAVSSAVLLSTLGAAGTIIGAALGSVVVTVSGALYSQGLARSRERLLQAQTAALRRVGVAQAEVRRAGRSQGDDGRVDAHLAHAQLTLDRARDDLDGLAEEPSGSAWRTQLATLPWKRIALGAAGLFVAAVVAITAFEVLVGESVSKITGGTRGDGPTIGRLVGDSTDTPAQDDVPPTEQPTPGGEPSPPPAEPAVPSTEPSTEPSAPAESPAGSDAPTPEPTPEPTDPGLPAPAVTPPVG